MIQGAPDTPYEKGTFKVEITVPESYPIDPPNLRFTTPIYHPNIDDKGRICLDILNRPPNGAWAPSLNISTVLTSLQSLMSTPNPDDGLMSTITEQYRNSRALFERTAREYTLKYATEKNLINDDPTTTTENKSSSTVDPLVSESESDDSEEEEEPVVIQKTKKEPPLPSTNTEKPVTEQKPTTTRQLIIKKRSRSSSPVDGANEQQKSTKKIKLN